MENLFVVVQYCVYGPEDGYRDEIREIENIYGPYSEEEAGYQSVNLQNKYKNYIYEIKSLRS